MPARRFTLSRCLTSIAGVVLCLAGIVSSGHTGYASYLAAGRTELLDPVAVNEAVRLDGANPHVRFARARLLAREGQPGEALKEFEKVVARRPEHFTAWLNLGIARQRYGNRVGAVGAFAEAVRLAPSYAQPRARHATALLLVGRRSAAFAEFRRAVASDPTLATPVTAFLWEQVGKDAVALEQALQPQSDHSKLALADFLVMQGRAAEGVKLYREATDISDETRHALVEKLIAANHFVEAHEVWAGGRAGADAGSDVSHALLIDGGFEGSIMLDAPGFGWRAEHDFQTIKYSLDTDDARGGTRSMRLDFAGESPIAGMSIISQTVLVKPLTAYRLRFFARTSKLVTGGLPIVVARIAGVSNQPVLAQTKPLPSDAREWQEFILEFKTNDQTRAVRFALERETCLTAPCPVFGRLWLDDFALEEL